MTSEEKAFLPYNTDAGMLEGMLNELKGTDRKGEEIDNMWTNMGEKGTHERHYALTLAKFTKLVETIGDNIRLTELGREATLLSGDKRKAFLIRNLPKEYMTMVKWIRNSNDKTSHGDMHRMFIKNFGAVSSEVVIKRGITTFFKYCEYIGLVKYGGHGRGSKVTLTDFGKKMLDSSAEYAQIENNTASEIHTVTEKLYDVLNRDEPSISPSSAYPVTIKTPDRTFFWDMKSESDWVMVETAIKSMREDWERKHSVEKSKKKGEVKPLEE